MRRALAGRADIEPHPALFLEQIERDAVELRRAPVVELEQHLVVGHPPVVVVEAHCRREPAEQLDIGDTLARR